jgi:hypothetical protein
MNKILFINFISYYFYYLIYFILKFIPFIRRPSSITFHISPIILSNGMALLNDRDFKSYRNNQQDATV